MKQKGQTLLEFAFVIPFLIFLFLSILYIGIMFMSYTQYNNAARDAARDISVLQSLGTRNKAVAEINAQNQKRLERYARPLTKLYEATWHAAFVYTPEPEDTDGEEPDTDSQEIETLTEITESTDVKITIELERDALPSALENMHILPEKLKTIEFRMKLEKNKGT